jgi:non-specific serine/threonine protein kinase
MGINPPSRLSGTDPTPRPLLTLLHGGQTGLPAALTPLVGREDELALIEALLRRPELRLLTLIGPGGIGKSRLAFQLASDLAETVPGGVFVIPLASVPDPGLVSASIAQVVGVQRTAGSSVRDELVAVLGVSEALLVVDNFEHVLDAGPVLTDLLSSCPRLKILVTSRVLLRVEGEHSWPVPPLSLPEPDSLRSIDEVRDAAAVRLFAERAGAVDPDFAVTAANATQVAEICRRLEGLPLAIELAAPRVRHLSLPALRDRLDRRLSLLTGGSRDQPRRLQTLRGAIAWSFDLLPPGEQALLCRLSVFAGGFSLEAAEAVDRGVEASTNHKLVERARAGSPTSRLSDSDILDGLAKLIDASLLQLERRPDAPERYRMLESIREFAAERLAATDEAVPVHDAHAAYFLDLGVRFAHADFLPDGDRVVTVLKSEHDNLRMALKWLEQAGDPGSLLRLTAALGRFWAVCALYDEGRDWLDRALELDVATAAADRAAALVHFGIIEIYKGAHQEAEAHLLEGLAGCQEAGNALLHAQALVGLGALASLQGNLDRGTTLFEKALVVARSVPDQRTAEIMAMSVAINLGGAAWLQGDRPLAVHYLQDGLRLARAAGHTVGIMQALGDLGDLARDHGEHAEALALYSEALDLGRKHPLTRVVAEVIEGVAVVTVATGRAERGARMLGAAEALRERIGLRLRVGANQPALEQAVAAVRAVLGEAAFAAAWAAGRQLSPAQAVAEALDLAMPSTPSISRGLLTPRETEILQLLAVGQTDPVIARTLSISVRTVESHVARILTKLGVRTRTAAATVAISTGLVDPLDAAPG